MPEPFYRVRPNEVMIGFNTKAEFVESKTQQAILEAMLNNPKISVRALAEIVELTPRGVQKNIDSLKKAGLVERVGAAKGGY